MDILSIIRTIGEHWALFVFVFGLGAAWWQGKMWFKNINESLEASMLHHQEHGQEINRIGEKLDNLDNQVSRIEDTVELIHGDLREQEIKLAVLEHVSESNKKRSVAR